MCDITATYNGETVTCKLTVIDDNVIDLKSENKQAAIDNAGNWNYFADGKSSVSATPTYNQKVTRLILMFLRLQQLIKICIFKISTNREW